MVLIGFNHHNSTIISNNLVSWLAIFYTSFLVTGIIGNLFVVVCYSCNKNKTHITYFPLVLQSFMHILLLLMSSSEFYNFESVVLKSQLICSIFSMLYKSLLLLEPWYIIFLNKI